MSYVFKKIIDSDNKYDTANITVEVPGDHTSDELIEIFQDFLLGCGFGGINIENKDEEDV